jgi:EAL domain-containing protein (putative c-di-GMP-specific phosphodiesterase class I)
MPLYVVVGTAIAKMLIVLAECLSLVVIAEGVETVAQRDFLLQLGCIAFQGYMFSRPLPVAEFEALATGWLSVPLAAH